jgi:putative hydrolase
VTSPPDDDPQDPDDLGFSIPGLGSFSLQGFDLSRLDPNTLAGMLASSGPLNWDVASQLAGVVATGGTEERPIDDATRAQLEELAHAAQTHVVAETGLSATFVAPVRALARGDWARLHLDALRPVLEALAATLGQAFQLEAPEDLTEGAPDPMAAMVPLLGPLLLGVQAGSMVGYLAQHALGRYDLPLPTADAPSLCFVVANLEEFETAWSLHRDDLRFYVAIHEVVHAATRSVDWVRDRLVALAVEYVSAYEIDASALEAHFGDIDPGDPASLARLAEHPEELLGAMQTPRQRSVLAGIRVFHAVLEGYADAILERIGQRLITPFGQIHEAMARHRIERGEAERFVEGLLGLAVGRDDYEQGGAFCRGVLERAGADGLNRLWASPEMLPTPNELAAPGLWLARIDLDLP